MIVLNPSGKTGLLVNVGFRIVVSRKAALGSGSKPARANGKL